MVARPTPSLRSAGRRSADAKEFQGVPDKFEKFFDPAPGSGSWPPGGCSQLTEQPGQRVESASLSPELNKLRHFNGMARFFLLF
jgi:hypothetical protein